MIIQAKEYIDNGFSQDDANKLSPAIHSALDEADANDEAIRIDFSGVLYYTTLFFNQALTYLVGQWGEEKYRKKIEPVNLPESGQETYEHALNYAIDYYAMDESAREQQDDAICRIIDEF
jgi:hypothetical protein